MWYVLHNPFTWTDGVLVSRESNQGRPISWPAHGKRENPQELTLTEIVVLQRTAKGERQVDIARALGLNKDYPRMVRLKVRKAFGVSSDAELFAHPDVIKQINTGEEP